MLTIGDVLRAHKDYSVEVFLAPGDGSGEAWIVKAYSLDEPDDTLTHRGGAHVGQGPTPEAAIDRLGRKLDERGRTHDDR